MKMKLKEEFEKIEKKVVTVLDKNQNGIVEPQEVLEVLTEIARDFIQLKQLLKGI